jgi:FAD/FMN-containing dehydrogenase
MHCPQLKIVALLAWAAAVTAWDLSAPSHQARATDDVNYTLLSQKLSKTAHIYLPGSDSFDAAVARWSNLSTPVPNVVVVVGTEADVIETVRLLSADPLLSLLSQLANYSTTQVNFANQYSVPFLTTNGDHGSIVTLGKMTHGIEIRLSQLNSIAIAKDGKTATMGGGVIAVNVTNALWKAGKQTGEDMANSSHHNWWNRGLND